MHLKGIDKFREKIPKYSGWRAAALGVLLLLAFVTGLTLMLLADSLARIYPHIPVFVLIEPILPILGVLMCELVAFRLVWGVWHHREEYVAEFGDLAYQRVIPRGLFGISWVLAICFHIYVPMDTLPTGVPVNPITVTFSRSILLLLGVPVEFDLAIRVLGSLILIILGSLTARSALLTFGIDYMALVYLYYPDESEIQEHEIYSVIRHPAYFGVLCLAAGGLMLRLSVFSFVLFLMFLLGLLAHILLVEEKELMERFGEAFIAYRERVPALYIRIRNFRTFFRFLVRKGRE
ncbi:MAG: methyltransferase family protein [Candidatus Thorarchaeota archaeon]|jgi:protein-S-isoprenylcysteine O-methyltransferase Ste14